MTARNFNLGIDAWVANSNEMMNVIVRKVALQALDGLIKKTPVDRGHAKGSWQVSIGGEMQAVSTAIDPTGTVTINAGGAKIATYQDLSDYPVVTIYSTLPYIIALEKGHSKQAPLGMMDITVNEIRTQFA